MSCNGCLTGCSECTAMTINPVYSPIKPRSMIITPGDTVQLRFLFRGADGQPADPDAIPTLSIISPDGTVALATTSTGVYRTDVGLYNFNYKLALYPSMGVWRDVWDGTIDGFTTHGEGTFQVNTTQLPATNTDGYIHLGDDVPFNYSQNALCSINKLIKVLRRRLKSSGLRPSCDEFGNIIYDPCEIFSTEELVTFLADSLSMFNEIPTFTFFTFDDTGIIELYLDVIVQGALYQALGAQALIERGREFTVSDSGLGFTPPSVSELLNTQYQKEMDNWYDKIKLIKMNMRPSPLGLGGMGQLHTSSAFRRLRTLRARQIY